MTEEFTILDTYPQFSKDRGDQVGRKTVARKSLSICSLNNLDTKKKQPKLEIVEGLDSTGQESVVTSKLKKAVAGSVIKHTRLSTVDFSPHNVKKFFPNLKERKIVTKGSNSKSPKRLKRQGT